MLFNCEKKFKTVKFLVFKRNKNLQEFARGKDWKQKKKMWTLQHK